MIPNLDELRKYLSRILNISDTEIKSMFDENIGDIATSSDCKIALSHAIRANRVLTQMKAATKGKAAERTRILKKETDKASDMLYKYVDERKRGFAPLGHKPMLEKLLADYQQMQTANWGQPVDKWKGNRPEEWFKYERDNIKSIDDIKFTSVAISQHTDMNPETANSTEKKAAAKAMAERETNKKIQAFDEGADAVSELLEGVRKEISALGSSAQIISSEQYGMNRTSKVD